MYVYAPFRAHRRESEHRRDGRHVLDVVNGLAQEFAHRPSVGKQFGDLRTTWGNKINKRNVKHAQRHPRAKAIWVCGIVFHISLLAVVILHPRSGSWRMFVWLLTCLWIRRISDSTESSLQICRTLLCQPLILLCLHFLPCNGFFLTVTVYVTNLLKSD